MTIHVSQTANLLLWSLLVTACNREEVLENKTPIVTTHHNTNRLINEKSPYLLQHAHNPVDWYPWGKEAFAKARAENKPIFLSVGYSTCHWCHVMERESFENEDIARILNEHFVSIKVDREERPDVDSVYMTYVQATTGGGGWPMSVWLTPDLKPFLGGTYYPPKDSYGRPGFASVLNKIADAWENNREEILQAGNGAAQYLQQVSAQSVASVALERSLLDEGYRQIKASYEPRHGGFGDAPKFPRPVVLNFMLRYYARTGTQDALDMSLHTLRKMAEGGMHDHVGGGFHRYSVDTYWHVPHFEKMLYDQAQLAISYLEAYQITRDTFYADVARDILDYVIRDMTGPKGQLYSAEDADSATAHGAPEKIEGAFYVWEQQEIAAALGPENADLFNYFYGVKNTGNAPDDPHGEFKDKNILIVRHTIEETATKFNKTPEDVRILLANARQTLFAIRTERPHPYLDDKTLTAWNGLMISAFARGYQVLDDERYLRAARRAADFVRENLYDAQTHLLSRRHRDGEAAIDGYQDDYAFFIQGLLDLYEASFTIDDLSWAIALQQTQDALFWDEFGGYFSTTGKDPSILFRKKDDYDGAEPSGNSVATLNLLRLSQMLNHEAYAAKAEKALAQFGGRLQHAPHAMPQMLVAIDFHLNKPMQIIIAGAPDAPDTRAMLREVHTRFIPGKIQLLADGGTGQKFIAGYMDFINSVVMKDEKATAYICENYACKRPTNDREVMASLLVDSIRINTQRK